MLNTLGKLGLVVLLVAGAYGIYARLWMRHYIAIGRELAVQGEERQFSRQLDTPTMRILMVGDSSLVGTGADAVEETLPYRYGARYPNAEIVMLGVNGSRTADVLEQLRSVHGQHFDVVHIHAGGNDIVRFVPMRTVAENYTAILQEANQLSDNVVVLHSGDIGEARLFPIGTRWILSYRTRLLRTTVMPLIVEAGAHYIDIYQKEQGRQYDPTLYSADLFHPSGPAYANWFWYTEEVLDTLTLPE